MSHGSSHSEPQDQTRLGGLNLKTYVTGFVLALILTGIPFGAVAFGWMSPIATMILVAVTAVIQIVVHLFFFLHLDFSEENRWNTASGAFSALIMLVLVGGTIWLFASLEMRTMMMGG